MSETFIFLRKAASFLLALSTGHGIFFDLYVGDLFKVTDLLVREATLDIAMFVIFISIDMEERDPGSSHLLRMFCR